MGGEQSKQNVSTTTTTTTMDASAIVSTLSGAVYPRQRTVENFLLVWVDANIDESKQNYQKCLALLRSVVNEVNIFTQPGQCIQFLNGIDQEKVFVITSGSLGENLVPSIHALPQLDAIYVFCWKKGLHEAWAKRWIKVKGVHNHIQPIFEALQQTVKQCNQDSIGINFVTKGEGIFNEKLKQLELSFKYTHMLKGILSEIPNDDKSIKILADYCRELYRENTPALAVINEFESNYRSKSPIWWYTRQCFIYQLLNRALRTLEEDIILHTAFFIRDLHQQIEQLYQQQVRSYRKGSFIVYRGQGLSEADSEKLLQAEGGLMSFDGFLFASTNRNVSLKFATSALSKTGKTGILFKITLNPSITSIPFVSVQDFSYAKTEKDILFSIHTVFRVNKITKIDDNKPLYQVDLQPVADNDLELRALTERIGEEVQDEKRWNQLGGFLITAKQFDKAERFCNKLLEQTSDLGEKAICYCQLGQIKADDKNYEEAIEYCKKGLELCEQIPPPNHFYLVMCYEYLGHVYISQQEYSEALLCFIKTLQIRGTSLPLDHLGLVQSYRNIAYVYMFMQDFSTALSFNEKAVEIQEKNVPQNHRRLAMIYADIAVTYSITNNYSNALSFYQKILEIRENTIPQNYQDIAETYDDIGSMYMKMEEYPTALSSHKKALEIRKKVLSPEHAEMLTSYDNLAPVYEKMNEYSQAAFFYEQSLEIRQKGLPSNHPSLGHLYQDICLMYTNMGDFSKAISFQEKALEAWQAMPIPNNPIVPVACFYIGTLYRKLKKHSKALPYFEKVAELYEAIYPNGDPELAKAYSEVAASFNYLGEYAKALSFYLKSLEMQERLDPDNSKLASAYEKVGFMYKNVKEYSKAIEYYERAKELYLTASEVDSSVMETLEANINFAKKKLEN
jgi:tetratricopeptide (TPR) repeat protein